MSGTVTVGMLPKWPFGQRRGCEHDGLEMTSGWFDAVKQRQVDTVRTLIQRGLDVNKKDQDGWNALHLAAWSGFPDVVETLLSDPGLELDQPGPGGCTALGLACQRGHLQVARILVSNKCDVNHACSLGPASCVTPLHMAAQHGHADVVRLLVNSAASVNVGMNLAGVTGITPLHLAVERNHMDVMDALLEAGCNVQSRTQSVKETDC